MNPTAILLITIWVTCLIAAIWNKDNDVMNVAFLATVLLGFGYLILHGK